MKKIIALLLTGVLLLAMVTGCTSKENTVADNSDVLRVGMDLKYYPFSYTDDNGEPAGLEVDIAKAFGEAIGREVEIVNTDFSMLIPALDTGDIDIIISDMAYNEERTEKVDFSNPYRYGRTLALVNKDFAESHHITNAMSEEEFFGIEDARFIGLSGTISVSVPQRFGKDVTEVTEIASGIMEVTQGTADVLVGANTIRGDYAQNQDTTVMYEGISDFSMSCFAVKKGNTELLEQANQFIDSMYAPGGFYEQAGTKYDAAIGEYMHDDSLGLNYIIYTPSGERVTNETNA